MVKETVLGNVIIFLDKIGVYDVILPFLLVFTIMFAILEKTRVLGEDTASDGKTKFTKKNLNSIVSFVIAFFVIASTQLVSLINEAMGNVVVLALVGVCTLMLLGVFYGTGEFKFDPKSWSMYFFTIFTILGVLLIFFHAIPYGDQSMLDWFYDYMSDNWDSEWVGSIILIGMIALFMYGITYEPTPKPPEAPKKE